MSVTEICARIEPSTYSTSEWMVDCGCTVTLHLRRWQVEEAAGLDDLQSLVEHGRGVDGDALAHDPGGVLERLRGRDVVEVCERGVAEGAAGGGEPDLLDLVGCAAAQALVDGVVLGVDGQQVDTAFACGREDEVAGGDEALLVGEADGLAGENCGVGGLEAGDADDGGDDEVGLGQRGDADGSGGAVDDFGAGDSGGLQARAELVGEVVRWLMETSCGRQRSALREGDVEVRAGGEGDGQEAIGVRLADAEG